MNTPTPNDFNIPPMDSVTQNCESEVIAQNIMVILGRTGNTWRKLSWQEYKAERQKDGEFTESERGYFDRVIEYTNSPYSAALFCKAWGRRAGKKASA